VLAKKPISSDKHYDPDCKRSVKPSKLTWDSKVIGILYKLTTTTTNNNEIIISVIAAATTTRPTNVNVGLM